MLKIVRALALVIVVSVCAFAQNAALMPVPKLQFLDQNGVPLAGGYLYTCVASASCAPSIAGDPPLTPLATFTDATAGTANPNPLVLDSAGRASVWLGSGSYKLVLEDATGATVWTQDGVSSLSLKSVTTSSGAISNFNVPGTLTAGSITDSGTLTSCAANGFYMVGSSCYPNIASAITAASSTGWVLIPKTYAGTDTYAVGGVNNVLDFRGSFFAPTQYIAPSRPITGYPLGNDLVMEADGPADLYVTHDSLDTGSHQTTGTSITAAVNTTILLSGSSGKFSPNAAVVVARETANEEYCNIISIPDASHLQINCPNYSHSGTTTVEQMGTTTLDRQSQLNLSTYQPAGIAHPLAPFRIGEIYDGPYLKLPIGLGEAFPASAIQVTPFITGMANHGSLATTAGDLRFRNSDSSHCVKAYDSTGLIVLWSACDSAINYNVPSVGFKIGNAVFISAANSGGTYNSLLGVYSDNYTKLLSTSSSGGIDLQNVGGQTKVRMLDAGRVLVGGTTDNGTDTVQINSGTIAIPGQKATTGARYVCINTTGQLISSASACAGT